MNFDELVLANGMDLVKLVNEGTDNVDRKRPPMGVIYHTPGRTFVQQQMASLAAKHKDLPAGEALEKLLEVRCAVAFDKRTYQPNILIGYTRIYLLDDLDQRALHAGSLPAGVYSGDWRQQAKPLGGSEYVLHGRDGHVVYDWWDAMYGAKTRPTKIFPWGHHPNYCIGVDLLPDVAGNYNDFQRRAVNVISKIIAELYQLPLDKFHFTTHAYASPCERGAVFQGSKVIGRHWDPDVKVWTPDWDAMNAVELNLEPVELPPPKKAKAKKEL